MRTLLLVLVVAAHVLPQNPTGSLSGREIVISPGHGYYWHSTLGWTTQRPLIDGLIEDIHTHEIIHDHLLPWLEGTGARTILCRARSRTVEEHVIQNDDGFPAYQETGPWTTSGSTGWGGSTYRWATASALGGSTASFRTTITTTDHYPVYVAYRAGTNRTSAARIEVTHAGGTSVRTIDQTRFDLRWLYVGTFPFRAMEDAVVTISSTSTSPGVVISDAVRIGDGFGSISRGGSTSGQLRWRECSRYHAESMGAPSTVWNPVAGGQDNSDDVTCRPLYGEWYAGGQADLYLSLHTNAGGGSGTSTFIHSFAPTAGSAAWQSTLHTRLITDIRAFWDPSWIDRGQMSANFGELRELVTMPGCLIELAFHDDLGGDVEALHHPTFRAISGRAMARAIVAQLAPPGTPLPLDPPTGVALRNAGPGRLDVSWTGVAGATAYRVRISEDGFAFDDGTVVTGTSLTLTGLPNDAVRYAKVAAVNASGTGIDSEPVGARVAPDGSAPLLLVNGFDRRDRSIKEANNPRDWLVVDGAAVQAVVAAGYPFDGCTNEAVAAAHVPLAPYRCVGWVLGEESTVDETFSSVEQLRINLYLSSGGRLFFSGAEVGWDLDAQGSSSDRAFYEVVLGQDYVADDSNTYWTQAQTGGPLGALPPMMFDDGTVRNDVDWPDVIQPALGSGGQIVLRYATGAGAAVLHGNGRILGLGFPLESLVDPAHRSLLMERVLATMCPLPVRAAAPPSIGATTTMLLDFRSSGGLAYIAAASAGTAPGIPLPDGRTVPVNDDLLFQVSLDPMQSVFNGMTGNLDALGQGSFQINVPNDPALSGFTAWFSAVTLTGANAVHEIAPWVKLTVP